MLRVYYLSWTNILCLLFCKFNYKIVIWHCTMFIYSIEGALEYLADPGKARGCSIKWVRKPFPPTALRRRHAQTVRDSSSSYKKDYVIVLKNFLNPKGHQNPISGSNVTVILLKGWILSIGEFASGRVCACSLRSRLVIFQCINNYSFTPIRLLKSGLLFLWTYWPSSNPFQINIIILCLYSRLFLWRRLVP